MRSARMVLLRFLAQALLAVWLGGFTFYSAVVVRVLHEMLGRLEAGAVTQRVTNVLNALGAATLFVWWLLAWLDRSALTPSGQRIRVVSLAVTSPLLVTLAALHWIMDERLARAGLVGFYPLHRAYLITSTVQWFANVGLLWTEAARGRSGA